MNLLVISSGLKQGPNGGFPLGLLYVAANDPNTKILDLTVSNVDIVKYIKENKPEIVGTTIYTPNRHDALRILKIAKKNGCKTVAGGPHVSVSKEQLLEYYGQVVDHFVLGDGELSWKQICSGTTEKVLKNRVENLDDLPYPDFSLVNWREYKTVTGDEPKYIRHFRGHDLKTEFPLPVAFGRGCSAKCHFCSTWWVNGKYHHHGKAWMEDLFQKMWDNGVRRLTFVDDCLTADMKAAYELCDALEKFDFAWFGTSRVDCIDNDLARRLSEVGCFGLSFGVETSSDSVLENMNKKAKVESAFSAREACRKAGIFFTALMMMGYPGMTQETQKQDNEFIHKLKPDDIGCLGETWVLPGTVLYNTCKRLGLITDDFWLGPEPYYVFPSNINAKL